MLESVDTSLKTDKEHYKERLPWLKTGLRELQQHARETDVPAIVVFEGWDTAGKGDAIQHVTEVLDPRGFVVHYVSEPTEEERHQPWLRRFWERLPHRGQIAFFERSWYTRVLLERVERLAAPVRWKRAYEEIRQFERLLTDDGYLLIKFWMHISEKDQRKRLKAARKDPFRRFTVTDAEWVRHSHYSEYLEAAEDMLAKTESPNASWTIVEAADKRHRRLRVLEEISRQMTAGMERLEKRPVSPRSSIVVPEGGPPRGPLDEVDLTHALDEKEYRARLEEAQLRLRAVQHEAHLTKVGIAIAYEGWDAAGKGGNIRRLVAALDPRGYAVVPVSKPTKEELGRNYLWRFWKEVPRKGNMTIYDRSWYGRVMVERIEGFCTSEEACRAYREINEFESQLVDSNIVVVKFWIHISAEEQIARFERRKDDPHKSWKLTEEDWRNREKWDKYVIAVNDMIERTSTDTAPWTIIEGNCKRWARVQALEAVCDAWERAIEDRNEAL